MEKISEHAMHPNQIRFSFAHMDFSNGFVLLTGNFRGKPKRKGKNGILSQVEPNIFVKAIIIRKKSSSSTSYVSLCDDLIDLELPIAVQMWQQVGGICIVESLSSTENLCFLASEPEGNIVLLEYRFRVCSEDSRCVISQTAKRAKHEETLENDSSKPMEMEQIACHVLPPAHGFGKLKHLAANRQVNSLACGMFDNAKAESYKAVNTKAVSMSCDGIYTAIACTNGVIGLWNGQNASMVALFGLHEKNSPISSLAFSEKASCLLVARQDGSVDMWK
ncbi:hypothetical protein GUITHDRAFT_109044 [Guillardia theta CCMP2712]|uniref:Uncharacterized protein n=1 Tax=Guillardia theta (strain CCMP2712) TaxID=905079 RepID=L1JA72_GUITC|nr:hypothetical protein GUITHDRAFT_109044 [Guillardia theta CCMP2712]EKX44999.1 hypothetical protein GUITHDRAFT_109044 [Guillardia theta CCMP2712]|eukprot:XP_005831979.1 hypothetical protein GUITHDRAFT_109044 [Guillardia theta CCMP2712]